MFLQPGADKRLPGFLSEDRTYQVEGARVCKRADQEQRQYRWGSGVRYHGLGSMADCKGPFVSQPRSLRSIQLSGRLEMRLKGGRGTKLDASQVVIRKKPLTNACEEATGWALGAHAC
jgi:hypothetical protein